MFKKIAKIILVVFFGKDRVYYIGSKDCVRYFFIQRILRINSHVAWPVHWSSMVNKPEKIKMTKRSATYPGFMPGCYIQAENGIEIGSNVWIGPGVKIISSNHVTSDFFLSTKEESIKIGNDCWLGANSVILPSVQLGDHTIVAAGAVVTKSFMDENIILAGIPAKIVKKIDAYTGKRYP